MLAAKIQRAGMIFPKLPEENPHFNIYKEEKK